MLGEENDVLIGLKGDDWYYAMGYNTKVVEAADGGIDTVYAWAGSYALPDNVENLVLEGGNENYGVGNALNNLIFGKDGSNSLYGGAGDDVLVGGGGSDYFVIVKGEGNDVIHDFKAGQVVDGDYVRLIGSDFKSFAEIKAAMTQKGADVFLQNGDEVVVFRDTRIEQFTADDFQMPLDRSRLGELTFSEEFDSLNLSPGGTLNGIWKTNYGYGDASSVERYTLPRNGELQIYAAPGFQGTSGHDLGINPFHVEDGVMSIRAEKVGADVRSDIWNYDYTSGLLTTRGAFSQQYGYFEIRADLPEGKGLWPAFWLLPDDGRAVEMDILEGLGHQPYGPYAYRHDRTDGPNKLAGMQNLLPHPEGFHTYGLLWTEDAIVYYLDGHEVFRAASTPASNTPMYLILNLAVGGAWPGSPDGQTSLPADFKIDYVHVYELASGAAPPPPPTDPAKHLIGGDGRDELIGASGADTLEGGAGNDYLRGEGGVDRMVGGLGDDTYVVHQTGDVIVELANQGWDTVQTWADYTLPDNVEFLSMFGVANIDATGNALNNTLRGNAGANDLYGMGGADRLEGWGGRDRLDGGAGNDVLNGGLGVDTFVVREGAGRDVVEDFVVGEDLIEATEFTAWRSITQQGADTLVVFSDNASLVLRNVQAGALKASDFVLKGSGPPPTDPGPGPGPGDPPPPTTNTILGTDAADSLKGTAAADRIEGRGGNDYIDGGAGADVMVGGAGNDSYLVDNVGDRVVELAGEGTDSVGAWISYVLPDEVEILNLKGTAAIDGTGNALNNRITGNDAANRLDGGGGADWLEGGAGDDHLIGGAGSDVFSFRPGFGHDVIHDFVAGGTDDRMSFTGFGSARPTVTQVGADTVIAFGTGEKITLLNVNSADLTSQDWGWG
ncbi:family 16 glycosylhydrolase [Caulobacter sp. 17J65-9]|uniref:family 16 glycosylhydrolase n=1 Tax=Caulobacter sp. 17J65-9 TaxID=2709382 RepID=UPI0013C88FD8|nr:family 16 glycosylhydrolase [Caulobacter sp. 17J65-9]NEX94660.1 family 16 glycosylhydrolase [Caulobacter sp. 17J65-9]